MLKKRLITAAVLLPTILLVLFLKPVWFWRVTVSIFIAIAWWEWLRLSKAGDKTWLVVLSSGALIGLMYLFFNVGYSSGVVFFSMILWLFAIAVCFIDPSRASQLVKPETKLLFGSWVLAFSWWSLIWLKEQSHGSFWVLGFLVIIWLADSGAYFAGKRFGKNKLAPAISPGKTIEGLIGGAFCVAIYAFFMTSLFVEYSRILLMVAAIVIAVVSVGGDLFESWMKRQANMKDSSQILPGHGGVLDRIDSLIAAMPFILTAYVLIAPHLSSGI